MQGRQSLVQRPVGDYPLESASSGKVFLLREGRQGRQRAVPHYSASRRKVFLLGSQAGQSACSTASRWRLTSDRAAHSRLRQAGQAARSRASSL